MADPRAPDFLLIGPQKSASTSLYEALLAHPQLVAPSKELQFFDVHYTSGMEWYLSKMPARAEGQLIFESCPTYERPFCLKRIAADLPDVKLLVYTLRDPVDRFVSLYLMSRAFNKIASETEYRHKFVLRGEWVSLWLDGLFKMWTGESRSVQEIMDDQDPWYLEAGDYMHQIEVIHGLFGRDRLHLIEFDVLVAQPQAEMGRLCDAVGVDHATLPWAHRLARTDFTSVYDASTEITENDLKRLSAWYRKPNRRLSQYLGHELNWK